MREQALRARPRRRGLPKDRGARSAVADNVLDRQFRADGPNQKWVADFTYIWTAEGWLYVAAVLDLYSRRIVGWSMQESMTMEVPKRTKLDVSKAGTHTRRQPAFKGIIEPRFLAGQGLQHFQSAQLPFQ